LYDLAFILEETDEDGNTVSKEYEPEGSLVNVTFTFKDSKLTELGASSSDDIAVSHLVLDDSVKDTSDTTLEAANDASASDISVETITPDSVSGVGNEDADDSLEIVTDSFSVFAVTVYQSHEAGSDTYETVLGDNINFAIVANEYTMGESETNFAAKVVKANQQSGNTLTNNVEQTFLAATIENTLHVKGKTAYFITTTDSAENLIHDAGSDKLKIDTNYSKSELETIVDELMQYAKDASNDLASRTATADLTTDGQKYYVDTTSYGAGTYYVNMSTADMVNIAQASKLIIKKNSDQTIVFNVTEGGTYYLQKYEIVQGGQTYRSDITDASISDITKTIIWNFEKASTVYASGSVTGVFIGPTSTWYNDNTSSGWIVFDKFITGSGEWHNTYQNVKQISGTATFEAYKTIDGEEAEVSGFSFTLYEKNDDGSYTEVETVKNDSTSPHNITFSSITFDSTNVGDLADGESKEFIYKIVENGTTTTIDGVTYTNDTTVYYAKVTVTKEAGIQSKSISYINVSAPTYYSDETCTVELSDRPTFNNTTTENSVTISLYKYLNDEDPGDITFNFTVRVLTSDKKLVTLSDDLTNDGSNISYILTNYTDDYKYSGKIYLIVTENDITDSNITKDSGIIIAKISNAGTDSETIKYYKINSSAGDDYSNLVSELAKADTENTINTGYITNITKDSVTTYSVGNGDSNKAAFYNTGKGNLRIHKMVVNDFGSEAVRDSSNAILKKVQFRITNNATGNYIYFQGFTDTSDRVKEDRAVEYDATTHKTTGNTYNVVYNNSAQWTILDLPAGTYTVEEVGDGITFTYDPSTNTSTIISDSGLSRVTKYDVTVDEENTNTKYGDGGNNIRKVFSKDLTSHSDDGPTNVLVGDSSVDNTSHTQTVQICNYYSTPIAPLIVNKSFTGGTWDDDLTFTFKVEAAGMEDIRLSDGTAITLSEQPMPSSTTVTISGLDAKEQEDGSYFASTTFGNIDFQYEGTYYYKITEVADSSNTDIDYDETVYYVKVVVGKKYTTFSKTYTANNIANYSGADRTETEDFYYLGADVTYTDESGNVLATISLTLGNDVSTASISDNPYTVTYTTGTQADITFHNALKGNLTVTKKWTDASGTDTSSEYTSLDVTLYRKIESDNAWTKCDTYTLTYENGWTHTFTGLDIVDESGNTYQYMVVEDESYLKTYEVTYNYIDANSNTVTNTLTSSSTDKLYVVDGESTSTVINPGYTSTISGASYGSVTITNKSVVINELPQTGGMGTNNFYITGLFLIIVSAFMIILKGFVRNAKD